VPEVLIQAGFIDYIQSASDGRLEFIFRGNRSIIVLASSHGHLSILGMVMHRLKSFSRLVSVAIGRNISMGVLGLQGQVTCRTQYIDG